MYIAAIHQLRVHRRVSVKSLTNVAFPRNLCLRFTTVDMISLPLLSSSKSSISVELLMLSLCTLLRRVRRECSLLLRFNGEWARILDLLRPNATESVLVSWMAILLLTVTSSVVITSVMMDSRRIDVIYRMKGIKELSVSEKKGDR